MELTDLLHDYGIEYITSGQDSSKNYVNIHCTVGCISNDAFKRGIRRDMSYSTCWVCGQHLNAFNTAKHLGIPWKLWKSVMDLQQGIDDEDLPLFPDENIEVPGSPFLAKEHKDYLFSRGLDWKFLQKYWNIKGTLWDDNWLNRNRIIVPIEYEGSTISYLMRSFEKNPKNRRYMMCTPENESFHHKHTFFNIDNAVGNKVIIVEGVFDLFKLVQASGNFNIIASYGTDITPYQLSLLKETYDEVIVLYDNEKLAQEKAQKIVVHMKTFGKKARSVVLKHWNDPNELDSETANILVKGLLG